jgi:hypothetical protein
MPRLKSTLKTLSIEVAQRAHNCRFNKNHRIDSGHIRLSIKEGRSAITYCRSCGVNFLKADMTKLNQLLGELQSGDSPVVANRE